MYPESPRNDQWGRRGSSNASTGTAVKPKTFLNSHGWESPNPGEVSSGITRPPSWGTAQSTADAKVTHPEIKVTVFRRMRYFANNPSATSEREFGRKEDGIVPRPLEMMATATQKPESRKICAISSIRLLIANQAVNVLSWGMLRNLIFAQNFLLVAPSP